MSTKSVVKIPEVIKLGSITAMIEGAPGKDGENGVGQPGPEGKSAFEVWAALPGNSGKTVEDYLAAIRGDGLVNEGVFALGKTYVMNDYVTAAGTATDSAIFFCKNKVPFVAMQQPRADAGNWTELVAPAGATGKNIELQKSATALQWRVVGESAWHDLVPLADLKGDPGQPGENGADGKSFSVDANGPTAQKPTYDNEKEGFAFLDTTTGLLYIKNSDASGDWSTGIPFKGDPGKDGPAIELQKGATTIQWRVVGSNAWRDLIPISDLVGANGPAIEMQATATQIQWRVVGATAWTNLIAVSALTGAAGKDGATWTSGITGPSNAAGVVGDFYLNTTTGEIHKKTAATVWTLQMTLPLTSAGAIWLLKTTDPVSGDGSDGYWALNSANGTIWHKGGTTWNKVLAIPAFATQLQATDATSYEVSMSPARVREYLEQYGLSATFTNTKTNLNLSVKGEFFNYDNTTLNAPGTSGYGRGLTIPSGAGYVTQLAIENDTKLMFVRYQSAGTWSAWAAVGGGGSGTVTFATTKEAQDALSTTVAMSPARTREYMEQYGITASYVAVTANLNTVVKGQMFNWDNTSTNSPVAASYGRGICIPAGTGYVTQLAIINDTGATYVRFQSGATSWSAWILIGPTAGGGGGGTSIPGATMSADKSLNKTGAVNLGLTGTVMPVTGMVYQFKATILTQSAAGQAGKFSIKFDSSMMGPQIFRADCRSPNLNGLISSSVSDQASVEVIGCNGPLQNGVTIIEGIIQFNYLGAAHPDLQLLLQSGDYMNILKGSSITYTPTKVLPL